MCVPCAKQFVFDMPNCTFIQALQKSTVEKFLSFNIELWNSANNPSLLLLVSRSMSYCLLVKGSLQRGEISYSFLPNNFDITRGEWTLAIDSATVYFKETVHTCVSVSCSLLSVYEYTSQKGIANNPATLATFTLNGTTGDSKTVISCGQKSGIPLVNSSAEATFFFRDLVQDVPLQRNCDIFLVLHVTHKKVKGH